MVILKIQKRYRYRIYPNGMQISQIQKTFGCCRFVHNYMLEYRNTVYKNSGEVLSKYDCDNYCTKVLKNKYEWLREPDKFALTYTIFDLDKSFKYFFKGKSSFPKFKSKYNHRKSYRTECVNNNIEVDFQRNMIKLPKLKWVNARIHRKFNGKIKNATVIQQPSSKYFVSITVEEECIPLQTNEKAIGIDLGVKDLLITSDGDKYANIHPMKKYEKKLVKEQRKLSHKKKGSKNYEKQRIEVAKAYEKIANVRRDYLHKISHQLIAENQVIVSEDLSVSSMIKNKNLSKAIADCGWGELTNQLIYKSLWGGRIYIKIGRFIPSSQICHACGYVNKEVKSLSVRKWVCPICGAKHDRDINAAKNILNEGLKMLPNILMD